MHATYFDFIRHISQNHFLKFLKRELPPLTCANDAQKLFSSGGARKEFFMQIWSKPVKRFFRFCERLHTHPHTYTHTHTHIQTFFKNSLNMFRRPQNVEKYIKFFFFVITVLSLYYNYNIQGPAIVRQSSITSMPNKLGISLKRRPI